MSNVISLAEHRNARIRDRLLSFALNGEAVIIDTRTGVIRADRVICRENAAEIHTSVGNAFLIGYGDIRDVRAGLTPQISAVSAAGDWVLPADGMARTEPSQVLAFGHRGQRR